MFMQSHYPVQYNRDFDVHPTFETILMEVPTEGTILQGFRTTHAIRSGAPILTLEFGFGGHIPESLDCFIQENPPCTL